MFSDGLSFGRFSRRLSLAIGGFWLAQEGAAHAAGRRDREPGLEDSLARLEGWAFLGIGSAVAGAALHLVLRTAGLSWTWILVALAGAPVVWLVSTTAGVALSIAGGTALIMALHWRHEDLERGGADARRERLGVGAALRSARRPRMGPNERVEGDRVLVGRTHRGRLASVPFGLADGRRGLIVGSPGSGKTVTMSAIAGAYVGRRLPVVCLDPKGDLALRDSLARAVEARGEELIEWSHEGPAIYNPFGRGDATEIADKALAGESWSEPHYLRQAQRYLGWVTRVLQESGEIVRLDSLVAHMEPDRLEDSGARCGTETQELLGAYLNSLAARQRAELGGVRDRLAVLAESKFGRYLDPAAGGQVVDLGEAWENGSVVYFRLDADRYPLASQMLGAAVVSDLVALTGERQRDRAAGLVAIDEFAAVGASQILRVLSRSRSAGISVLVATQGLADLGDVGGAGAGENLTARVLSQLDFTVAHRQPEPVAAEQLSRLCGTRVVWAMTERVQSSWTLMPLPREGTRTRSHQFVRHPDEFKRLAVGEAILIEPAARAEAQVVQVWPAEPGARGDARGAVPAWHERDKALGSLVVSQRTPASGDSRKAPQS